MTYMVLALNVSEFRHHIQNIAVNPNLRYHISRQTVTAGPDTFIFFNDPRRLRGMRDYELLSVGRFLALPESVLYEIAEIYMTRGA